MTTLDPRDDVQSRIDGKLVARMIVEFHRELRDTYGTSVMVSDLCAVGPLQSMIGLAIKNGHLAIAPSQPAAVGVTDAARAVVRAYDDWSGAEPSTSALERAIDVDLRSAVDAALEARIEAALRSTP